MSGRRVADWPRRLSEIINIYADRDYEWGVSDCGTFACEIIKALIGVDLYRKFAGKYNSTTTYLRLLANENCKSISELFEKEAAPHGIGAINKRFAQRGDIVAVHIHGVESLGVCVGSRAMFHVDHGLISIQMRTCNKAWSVR